MSMIFILTAILSLQFFVQAVHETVSLVHNGKAFEFKKIREPEQPIHKPHVPFTTSIAPFYTMKRRHMNFIASIYEARNFKTTPANKKFLIPPIIHQIWLGSPFPEKYHAYQRSIFNYHTNWLYKLWTEEDILRLGIMNKDLLNQACTHAEKANIIRYEILNIFGGVYIDTDMELLKPLSSFHRRFDLYVGLEGTLYTTIGNALIGSRPGHPLLQHMIKTIKDLWTEYNCAKRPQLKRSGVRLWTKILLNEIKAYPQATIFPPTYFYPWRGSSGDTKKREKSIKPESFAIHDYDLTWVKQTLKK